VAVKTVVENKKRRHMLLMSDFIIHIILYEKDFNGRVNSEDYRKMFMEELIVRKKSCMFSLFIYLFSIIERKRN